MNFTYGRQSVVVKNLIFNNFINKPCVLYILFYSYSA